MGFTEEQNAVINSRNKNLLVSAAAGSGKTAVLTERIAGKICDKDNPSSIDRMLIVTFTNAAAKEMRERIGARLREKLAEEPGNVHIRKQIAILHTAQITTIDSFCLYILRNHFEDIGIDPAFIIGSEGEISQISEEAFEETLEEEFTKGDEEFLNLVEMYAPKGRFDEMKKMVLKLANNVDSTPYPYETLEKFIVGKVDGFKELPFAKFVREYEDRFLSEAKSLYVKVRDITAEGELLKHNQEALAEISFINSLLESDFRYRTAGFNSHERIRLAYGRKAFTPEDQEKKAEADVLIKRAVDIVDGLKKKFHYTDSDTYERLVKEGCAVSDALIGFVLKYMKKFDEKKRDKGVISFSDMEHLALEILVKKEDGRLVPTKTADCYRNYFEEVMIDEYQDSNEVQELILSMISKDDPETGNRFMVGDIKQSIYGFRQAKPEIFGNKCRTYSKDRSKRDVRINLSKNFRSRSEVIDAVNFIFERCMKEEVGKVAYDEDERLYLGLTDYPESKSDNTAELLFFSREDMEANEFFKDFSDIETEALMVALRIRELCESETEVFDKKEKRMRPMKYSDIAILLRSMDNAKDTIFQKALKEAGIPAYVISKAGYYGAWEVQLILNLLSIIDNPRQDLPLLGVLHSFIGGFSEEEIARIRIHGKRKRLIDSMYLYLLEGEDGNIKAKIEKFTDELDELRKKSLYMSASAMLREIYEKYEYEVMVSSLPNGEQRLANAVLLIDTADEYETLGIYSIHDFIRYIENLKAREVDMGEANMLDENADVVRIMTIHKSKGLEFPICFVSSMHTAFKDTSGRILYDEEFGMGSDAFNLSDRTKRTSPVKRAIEIKDKVNRVGEEIRVLYVALTRAREKLILTGKLDKDLPSKNDLSFVDIMSAASFMEIVYPLIKEEDIFEIKRFAPEELVIEEILEETERISKKEILKGIAENEDFEEYRYPHESLESLFVKTTVSELKKAAYLEREDGENTLYHKAEKRIPKFVSETEEGSSGARRGTAYHRVMELMDFINIYEGDLKSNLRNHRRKMIEKLFIYEADDALVNENKVLNFLSTDLSKRMSEAAKKGKLYLEQPFVLSVNAHEVREEFPETEKVLVQGVIDVYFEEDGKLILMDYKTDRVDSGEELVERYKTQLDYYAEALSRLEKKPVSEIFIYSFSLSEVIKV